MNYWSGDIDGGASGSSCSLRGHWHPIGFQGGKVPYIDNYYKSKRNVSGTVEMA